MFEQAIREAMDNASKAITADPDLSMRPWPRHS
jgi:hypothetical protein